MRTLRILIVQVRQSLRRLRRLVKDHAGKARATVAPHNRAVRDVRVCVLCGREHECENWLPRDSAVVGSPRYCPNIEAFRRLSDQPPG